MQTSDLGSAAQSGEMKATMLTTASTRLFYILLTDYVVFVHVTTVTFRGRQMALN